ncbi:MAG: hypothetical protein KGJ13_01360 [Patescibacteria group bacterium]|nr:hypothetical protein [Patescibacteria group bacterium]
MSAIFYRTTALILLLLAVTSAQFYYDVAKLPGVRCSSADRDCQTVFSPEAIRLIDLGFNATIGSFLWAGTMPEILDLFLNDKTEYIPDVRYINAVDPKLSYPYAFSVLTLPAISTATYPQAITEAQRIGERGLLHADPDWRIPYYMAINYFLELKDGEDALKYFDIAAQTPGIPDFAKRFAENFGIGANDRKKVEELWATIRDSTNDPDTKARAQAYIDRLQIFDYLEAAAKVYKQRFGSWPAAPQVMADKGIIPFVPQDPFGYTFIINKDGSAGINVNKYPG